MSTQVAENSSGPLPIHYMMGARELVIVAWRRKYYALACIVLSLSVGAVYFLRADHSYEVKARLLVEKQNATMASTPPEKPVKDLEFLATQAEILKSPTVVARAAEKLDWTTSSSHSSPTQDMINGLSVRPVMGTSVLSVSFQTNDPARAVQGVEAIVESYRRYLNESERGAHLETLALLTRNEKELRSELQALEQQYAEFRKNSPLGGKGRGGVDVQMALVEELGRQLAQARSQRVQLENELQIVDHGRQERGDFAEVSTTGGGAYFATTTDPVPSGRSGPNEPLQSNKPLQSSQIIAAKSSKAVDIENIQKQLIEAQMREKDLAARYGYKHPDLRAAREQIAELMEQYREALEEAPEILRNQLDAASANEQQLAEMYRVELEAAKSIDQFILEEDQLVAQTDRVRALHDSMVDQLRNWKLSDEAVADGRSRIRVILLEQPTIPLKPVWPDPALLFGICASIGLVAAAGVIALLEVRSPSVRAQPPLPATASNPLVPAIGNA